MMDKGYAHPLHTLNLRQELRETRSKEILAIRVEQGWLVTRPGLLAQGQRTKTEDCVRAVQAGLDALATAPPGLAGCGIDASWAENMRSWCQRAISLDAEARSMDDEAHRISLRARDLSETAQRMWTRLRLASKLAGLGRLGVVGSLPRRRADQVEALATIAVTLNRPVVSGHLAMVGIGDEDRQAIAGLTQGLRSAEEEGSSLVRRRRWIREELVVIRAALLGDLFFYKNARKMVSVAGPVRGAGALEPHQQEG